MVETAVKSLQERLDELRAGNEARKAKLAEEMKAKEAKLQEEMAQQEAAIASDVFSTEIQVEETGPVAIILAQAAEKGIDLRQRGQGIWIAYGSKDPASQVVVSILASKDGLPVAAKAKAVASSNGAPKSVTNGNGKSNGTYSYVVVYADGRPEATVATMKAAFDLMGIEEAQRPKDLSDARYDRLSNGWKKRIRQMVVAPAVPAAA